MKRAEIFAAIEAERIYQVEEWGANGRRRTLPADNVFAGESGAERSRTVGEFLTYMRHTLTKADAEATEKAGDEAALNMLRKVVALGVACFEQHGCPPRQR